MKSNPGSKKGNENQRISYSQSEALNLRQAVISSINSPSPYSNVVNKEDIITEKKKDRNSRIFSSHKNDNKIKEYISQIHQIYSKYKSKIPWEMPFQTFLSQNESFFVKYHEDSKKFEITSKSVEGDTLLKETKLWILIIDLIMEEMGTEFPLPSVVDLFNQSLMFELDNYDLFYDFFQKTVERYPKKQVFTMISQNPNENYSKKIPSQPDEISDHHFKFLLNNPEHLVGPSLKNINSGKKLKIDRFATEKKQTLEELISKEAEKLLPLNNIKKEIKEVKLYLLNHQISNSTEKKRKSREEYLNLLNTREIALNIRSFYDNNFNYMNSSLKKLSPYDKFSGDRNSSYKKDLKIESIGREGNSKTGENERNKEIIVSDFTKTNLDFNQKLNEETVDDNNSLERRLFGSSNENKGEYKSVKNAQIDNYSEQLKEIKNQIIVDLNKNTKRDEYYDELNDIKNDTPKQNQNQDKQGVTHYVTSTIFENDNKDSENEPNHYIGNEADKYVYVDENADKISFANDKENSSNEANSDKKNGDFEPRTQKISYSQEKAVQAFDSEADSDDEIDVNKYFKFTQNSDEFSPNYQENNNSERINENHVDTNEKLKSEFQEINENEGSNKDIKLNSKEVQKNNFSQDENENTRKISNSTQKLHYEQLDDDYYIRLKNQNNDENREVEESPSNYKMIIDPKDEFEEIREENKRNFQSTQQMHFEPIENGIHYQDQQCAEISEEIPIQSIEPVNNRMNQFNDNRKISQSTKTLYFEPIEESYLKGVQTEKNSNEINPNYGNDTIKEKNIHNNETENSIKNKENEIIQLPKFGNIETIPENLNEEDGKHNKRNDVNGGLNNKFGDKISQVNKDNENHGLYNCTNKIHPFSDQQLKLLQDRFYFGDENVLKFQNQSIHIQHNYSTNISKYQEKSTQTHIDSPDDSDQEKIVPYNNDYSISRSIRKSSQKKSPDFNIIYQNDSVYPKPSRLSLNPVEGDYKSKLRNHSKASEPEDQIEVKKSRKTIHKEKDKDASQESNNEDTKFAKPSRSRDKSVKNSKKSVTTRKKKKN